MERIGDSVDLVMKGIWARVKNTFDEKALWILAEKGKYPYSQWAAEELISRKNTHEHMKNN